MTYALRTMMYAGLPALALAACDDAGDDDAERAAREAAGAARSAGEAVQEGWESGDDDAERAAREAAGAARSAGEAVQEGWESGDDDRSELAEETGEAVDAMKAQVSAEWHEHRGDRRAALEAAGDHAEAAAAAVASGLDAAAETYARTVGESAADENARTGEEPEFGPFAYQDERVGEEPLNGSIEIGAGSGSTLAGAEDAEAEPRGEIDRDYVPSHRLDLEPHPCADHDHETCSHTHEEHARCTPERG